MVTAVALCYGLPVVSSAQGVWAGYSTEWEILCCPASGKVAQGKQGESLASPRALSTCFLAVGEASALSRLLRGRKGWVQDFPSFRCQPSLPASLGHCLACPAPCFPTCVPFICLWHVLALLWLCFRHLSCRPWMNPNHPSPDSDLDFLPSFRP